MSFDLPTYLAYMLQIYTYNILYMTIYRFCENQNTLLQKVIII